MSASYERYEAACDCCRNKKIRCDKIKPCCSNCQDLGIECYYGTRLKRGPKKKSKGGHKNKKKIHQIPDQLQNIQKPSHSFQEILFELESNRKLVELWKKMLQTVTIEQIRPVKPTFSPQTEAFIRSPQALKIITEEFEMDVKHHFKLSSPFAGNADLAQKIWTAILEVHLNDLLAIFDTFKTDMLLSVLEYLGAFIVPLKLYNCDDIAHNIAIIIRHITDTVVYVRDGTEDKLTAQQLHQLVSVLWVSSGYYKMCRNVAAHDANVGLTFGLYNQYKKICQLNNEVLATEAAMYCCSIIACRSSSALESVISRINHYDELGVMTPDLQQRFYMSLSLLKLVKEEYKEAEMSLQKAELFVEWNLSSVPSTKRELMENYFKSKLYLIRTEISFQSGNITAAFEQVAKLRETFMNLPESFQRLVASHCHLFMWGNRLLFSVDYIKLIMTTPTLNIESIFAAMEENARLYGQDELCSYSVERGSSPENSSRDQDISFDELLNETSFQYSTPLISL